MRSFFTSLMLLCSFSSFAQLSVDKTTGKVSNFNAQYRFTQSSSYDYDLKTYGEVFPAPSIVGVDIDENGTGRLFIYITQKLVFTIESCYLSSDSYRFFLKNYNGEIIKAVLTIQNNYISAFWINNNKENTALILN
jgi:hypothetical protein